MKTTVVKYGLQDVETGKIIGVQERSSSTPNEGVGIEYQLDRHGGVQEWYNSSEHAEWVRLNDTEWYNSGYDTPQHMGLVAEQMRVVKVTKIVDVTPAPVEIPTKLELARAVYGKGGKYEDVRHLANLEKNIDEYELLYWDYAEYYRIKEKRKI